MIKYRKNGDIIENVKREGAVHALKTRIGSLKHALSHVWNLTENGQRFVGLGKAIQDARGLLDAMEDTLNALAEMEPGNK